MNILFASMPFDGHFNPLTAAAVYLRERGHDVRFYAGASYAEKLQRLGIPHLPFQTAIEVNGENLAEHFPEYERLGNGPKAIDFALTKIFFGNVEAHLRDIVALRGKFAFDALVCDAGFYAAYPIAKKLGVPTFPIAPSPTPAPTSPSATPPFFGLTPARTPIGRLFHRVARSLVERSTRPGMALFGEILARNGLPPYAGRAFDVPVAAAHTLLQIGVPGMDFPREDWPASLRFIGALVPASRGASALSEAIRDRLANAASVVVVSQGTIDNRDPDKLLAPTLAALAGGPHLVVACTGGRNTEALRSRFPHDNLLIEDFVPFDQLMPHADVFVCNGGYGSILQALVHGVPIVAAGKKEGKNDINARIAWRRLGVDLKTERPKPARIQRAVARVLGDPAFAANVEAVRAELGRYEPLSIIETTITGSVAPAAASPDVMRSAS